MIASWTDFYYLFCGQLQLIEMIFLRLKHKHTAIWYQFHALTLQHSNFFMRLFVVFVLVCMSAEKLSFRKTWVFLGKVEFLQISIGTQLFLGNLKFSGLLGKVEFYPQHLSESSIYPYYRILILCPIMLLATRYLRLFLLSLCNLYSKHQSIIKVFR